jgi:hypothetical protein
MLFALVPLQVIKVRDAQVYPREELHIRVSVSSMRVPRGKQEPCGVHAGPACVLLSSVFGALCIYTRPNCRAAATPAPRT